MNQESHKGNLNILRITKYFTTENLGNVEKQVLKKTLEKKRQFEN